MKVILLKGIAYLGNDENRKKITIFFFYIIMKIKNAIYNRDTFEMCTLSSNIQFSSRNSFSIHQNKKFPRIKEILFYIFHIPPETQSFANKSKKIDFKVDDPFEIESCFSLKL